MSGSMPPPPVPTPAIRHSRPVTTGATYTVACKLPNGLHLRVFEMHKVSEPQQGGGVKPIEQSRPIPGMEFIVKGPWVGSAGQAFARNNPAVAELLPGGYALTHGVPAEIWDRWYEQNKGTALVRNKIVFAYASPTQTTDAARANREVKSGLEPLNPDKPADRMPGGTDRRVRMDVFTQDEGTLPR